ncbi:hypothetical protein [Kitasatospora sp. HPMI-4]|uniref:hypothetical protein n=1 Tax=Kitasatospora sp. HPMI-4 TaxID=3448443 RepID=UPI003F1B42A7
MTRDQIGRLIGGALGALLIQAGTGALPTSLGVFLRALALVTLVGMFAAQRRGATGVRTRERADGSGTRFGRRYWYAVAAGAAALVAGLAVIYGVLHARNAALGWAAFVVGVHFFGLATTWNRQSLRVLGGAVAGCGLVALALAGAAAPYAAVATVGGVVPGALLLVSVRSDASASVRPADPAE